MQGTQKMQFIIMIELSKVIDPWLAIQWQERTFVDCIHKSALVRLRGIFVYVCWHHSQALSFVNFAQLNFICHFNHQNYSPFPVIWVIKVIELDWLLLIQLLTRKLISKRQSRLLWQQTMIMDKQLWIGSSSQEARVLLRKQSWDFLNASWNFLNAFMEINKVRICHFYGIIA